MSKSLRALIVDDSEKYAESVLQSLQECGYQPVLKRVDSPSAMNTAVEKQVWDFVIADYFPAPFNAVSALKLLKEKSLDLPFIMVAERINEKVKKEAIHAGVDVFLLKEEMSRLGSIVQHVVDRGNIYCDYRNEPGPSFPHQKILKSVEEKIFESIFKSLDLGLMIVSADMEVLFSNRQARMWFPKAQELKRSVCYRKYRGAFNDTFCDYCPTRQSLKNGGSHKYIVKNITPEGYKTYQIIVLPITKKRGKPTAALQIIEDITYKKQKEDALRKSREQLRQSQKTEALGMLASGMTHDLNNMLTAIMGYADLMLMKLKRGDPYYGNVEQIKKGSLRAVSMIQHLLNFNRKQDLEKKALKLNDIIYEVESIVKYVINDRIKFILRLDPATGKIKGDKGQVEQIIMNLCLNAGEAMPQGGELIVETANSEICESDKPSSEGIPPGCYVRLAIRDTGRGMEKEALAHIYEPFYTTKDRGEGTGLGLSTVYGIVNQSKGHIRVNSELGEGTSFEIYLPRIEDEDSDDLGREQGRQKPLGGSEAILLVEDEVEVRTMLREVLQRSGYKVIEARSPGDAILVCEQYSGMIHLMIADVIMPMMSGRELIERLSLWHPEMKALYMSDYTEGTAQNIGGFDESAAFLKKPFRYKSLLQKVRKVLGDPGNTKNEKKDDASMIQYSLF